MQHLAAVEAGVEHADADRDRREGLGLEPADEGVGVGHVGGEHLGVAALVLRMQLVQVPRCSGEHVVHHVDQEACGAGGEVVDGVAEFQATISTMKARIWRGVRNCPFRADWPRWVTGRHRIRSLYLGADHRFVEWIPAGLPQPVVDRDSRVRFGMARGHPMSLCTDGVVLRECTALASPACWSANPIAGVVLHCGHFRRNNAKRCPVWSRRSLGSGNAGDSKARTFRLGVWSRPRYGRGRTRVRLPSCVAACEARWLRAGECAPRRRRSDWRGLAG